MTTAVFEVAQSLPLRFNEIDTLLNCAADNEGKSEQLYDSICRACCVLLASHLEGFVKDFSKSIVKDFNYFSSHFRNLPEAIKNTFCSRIVTFEGVQDSEILKRTRQLIAYFNEHSIPIDITAFPYKENQNKNPASKQVDMTFEKLGIPSILSALKGSYFESIFGSTTERYMSYTMMREIKSFRHYFYTFPYSPSLDTLSIEFRARTKGDGKTLWHDFIDDIMVRRHRIAHGESLDNEATHQELRLDLIKLYALMNSIMYAACGFYALKR